MSQQGLRQASVRAATGTALTYEGDWTALFDAASIPAGTFNGRLLAWINARLGTAYTELNGAMQAYAVSQGAASWSEMGTFSPGGGSFFPTGSSSSRYSFAGTGFRWPRAGVTVANIHNAADKWFYSPDYEITNPRFFMPSFWNTNAAEVEMTAGLTVKVTSVAVAVGTGGTPVGVSNETTGIGTYDSTTPGVLLPAVPITIPANSLCRVRVIVEFSATGGQVPNITGYNIGTAATTDRAQGSASSLFSLATAFGTTLSNAGGVLFVPAYMVAQGGDGRPVFLILGDSIGFGVQDTSVPAAWSSRREFGAPARALDEGIRSKRVAYHNSCIPGQGPHNWASRSYWSRKADAIKMVTDAQGAPPFDAILNQHFSNSSTVANPRTFMSDYFTLLHSEYGANVPIIQAECIPRMLLTSAYPTTQTVADGSRAYPGGAMFDFNIDCGGVNGGDDPTAYFRLAARGTAQIAASIPVWHAISLNTGNDRDLQMVEGFETTVATSIYTGTTTINLTHAPTVGMGLLVVTDADTLRPVAVSAVSGTGPYSVSVVLNGGANNASVGNRVFSAYLADGVHPSSTATLLLKEPYVDWLRTVGLAA